MAVTFLPATPWAGREDDTDGPDAKRLHHLEGGGPRALIGFACDIGVRRSGGRPGARKAPNAIRRVLSDLAAPEKAAAFKDLGTIDVDIDELSKGQEALAGRIGTGLKSHDRIVVLGGGQETAYGSFLGLHSQSKYQKIGIIHLSARLGLSARSDQGGTSATPFHQIQSLASERFDCLCIGIAGESNTKALFDKAANWGVTIVRDHVLIANPGAADQAIESIIARSDAIYISVDMSVLPQEQALGVSQPSARGIPFTTAERLVAFILNRARATGTPVPVADIVEVAPPLDMDNITARRAAFLARRLLQSA